MMTQETSHTNPRVSVVIPMRNAAPFVRDTLASILPQADDVACEVIVVDDGSTDGSAEVVRSFGDERVRLIEGPQAGNIALTLNAGLSACRGEVFMRCDADDWFEPGRLARQWRWLVEHPDYAAVCGTFVTTDAQGRQVALMDCGGQACEITSELQAGRTRTHLGTFAVRIQAVRQLDGFRAFFSGTEDIDFQLRLADVGRVWFEPVACYRYRLHDASSTHTQATVRREFLTETARRFAIQRQETGQDDLQRGCPPPLPPDDSAASGAAAQIQGILTGQAWRQWSEGRRWRAIRTGLRALAVRPGSLAAWRSLAALCFKPRLRRTASE